MNIKEAVDELAKGNKVRRKGWEDEILYVHLSDYEELIEVWADPGLTGLFNGCNFEDFTACDWYVCNLTASPNESLRN